MGELRGGRLQRRLRETAPLVIGDALLTCVAWTCAVLLRFDGDVPLSAWSGLRDFLPVVVLVTVTAYFAIGLYSGVLRFASVLEARQILVAQCVVLGVLFPVVWLTDRPVPLSVPIMATVISCGMAGALRFWSRLLRWRHATRQDGEGERILVIGAGEAGDALARDIRLHHSSQVVGFLDDNERLHGRKILGIRVLGTIDELPEAVEASAATRAVLAITHADSALVRRIVNRCHNLGVGLSIVPPQSELLGRQVSLQDVRDIEIADLLGRAQVDTDLDAVRHLVEGRRVLITGGGGSIGSELARQVASFGPATLVLVDHDETHLFEAVATLPPEVSQRLADIRDHEALRRVFREANPDIVFHAAALKHVPILETHAVQAVHTNVIGTRNVVRCAEEVGVERFVFISTDKAVRPSSVMGSTKLAGEHLVLGRPGEMTVCAVRFGNVLGSRGSVVPTFVRQIRAGGPVTITDARMTRYFMSIPEAVRLVLHAAALSTGREIFMLDMGEPIRIIDLAKRMIQLSGQRPGADIEIRVTAMRPGEKLAEELHAPDERRQPTSHPSIVRLEPVHIPAGVLRSALSSIEQATNEQDAAAARAGLALVLQARQQEVDTETDHEVREEEPACR
ncbi:polysaccharide biosynthesis protein [Nocardioides sp. GXQ0305]|uniref:polysaccharide biosynthesis protein n=1 Tax=Nocardioides sp. GXQ0305 TaxID=3423912 RepID=UPI003D7CED56